MKRLVWHCPYHSLEHFCLIKMGWEELDVVLRIDGEAWIKMQKWFKEVTVTVREREDA